MKYKLVIEISAERLEEEVNKLLADGWELWGEIAIVAESELTYQQFIQALVKK